MPPVAPTLRPQLRDPVPRYIEGSSEFYGDGVVPNITIDMNGADWDDLDTCTELEYQSSARPDRCQHHDAICTIRYLQHATTRPCGVRRKGSATWQGMSNGPSLKVTLRQRWRGLRKLTLNNMLQDRSKFSERLAYKMYS